MVIEDYAQVMDLWKSCEGIDLNEIDESKEGVARYLKRNPKTCLVEEKDGRIVGVIMAGHDGRRGSIHHLAVREKYRKQGIGKSLLACVTEALKKQGIRKTGIFVYENNHIGKEFWNSQGFLSHDDYFYMDKEL